MKAESFDLNLAIQRWRENLAQSPAFRSENLNELESHLRDSIADLQAKGLTAEEAFLVAVRRIGPRKALEGEFGKVNGTLVWLERGLLVLLVAQIWNLAASVSAILTCCISVLALDINQILPGFGLQEFSDQSIRAVFGFLCSQFVTAIVMGWAWWRFIRPRKWTTGLFENLLRRPWGLALAFLLVCAVFRVISAYLMQTWYWPIFEHTGGFSFSFRYVRLELYEYAILGFLTFFVARKRLRTAAA